jgi:hypothetical protein
MNEHIDMEGRLRLTLTDRDGRVMAERVHQNRIVKTGRRLVAELFAGVTGGTPPSRVTHMAVGTGAAAAADDQTGLGAERAPRKPITEVIFAEFDEVAGPVTTRRVKATLKAVFDFNEANDLTVPLREAGIFTAASAGVMYNRVVFEPVTKTNAFQLTMLWDITF